MKWHFNELQTGFDYQGIRDGDIEVFDKTRYQSVVRESIQNSLDARLDYSKPVKIEFNFFKVEKKELPGIEEIENVLKYSSRWDKANKDDQALLNKMIDSIEEKAYSCLEIADYNTRGMQAKTTFDSFAHARNVSTKSSGTSAGSKGMGKAAYFALSYLRTLVVSSIYYENKERLFQGISRVSTFPKEDKLYNYKGYYSTTIEPETTFDAVSDRFKRDEVGTSIFVLGLWKNENGITLMKKELVNHFWLAILENDLIVTIDGEEINRSNIYELIKRLYPSIEESSQYNSNPNPRAYFETYIGEKCIQKVFTKKIEHLGEVKLILGKNNQFQGRIANFRLSKMLIYKDPSFLYKGYCGVFVCLDPKGNEILKKLENATHTEWKLNNWKDPIGKKALNEYKNFIINSVNEFIVREDKGEITIDAFDDLLQFTGNQTVNDKGQNAVDKPSKVVVRKVKSEGVSEYIPKSFNWIRNRVVKTSNGFEYHIDMDSKVNQNSIYFEILVGNDDSSSKINITSLNKGDFNENRIALTLMKGTNHVVLKLDDFLKHTIRLKEIEAL